MRSVFYLALSAIATLAAAAENPFNIPNAGYSFTAGETTQLSWDPTTEGTVTLKLQWGATLTPDSGTVLESNVPNTGSYTWNVPSDLVAQPDYTIEIISDSDPEATNYLPRFTVSGASAAPSSSVTSSSTTESTSSPTPTTMSTTTTTSTSTTTSETPSPTPSSSSTTTSTSSTSTESSTTETPTPTPTDVPNTNAGMVNRVSGGMLALVMGAVAVL